jgi:hypothetical protein
MPIGLGRALVVAVAAVLLVAPQPAAQSPSPAASRPDLSGTWMPAEPAKSDRLFDVGLSTIPGSGRMTIEQTPNRFTVTITMPDERLDPLLTIGGRFYPTIIYRVYESGRAGGAGAGAQVPSLTSWVGDRLVIPNARPGTRPTTTTFSMDGERLKMETRVEVDATRANNVVELFTKVK